MIKKLITAFLFPLLLVSGCQAGSAAGTDPVPVPVQTNAPAAADVQEKPASKPAADKPAETPLPGTAASRPVKPDTELTLVVSGDVLSHVSTLKAALQKDGSYDYMPILRPVQELLSSGDYTLVNLETAVAGEKYGYRGFPKFNAPLSMAKALKELGVDMVATANNHAMDSGIQGLRDNLDNLDKIGLKHVGTYRSREEAQEARVVDINGIKVGFAATTSKVTMEFADDFSVNRNKPKTIRREIAKLREAGAELIVFHIHWGKEYTEYPTQVQMDLYQILEEEGVDIVVGSHPHRLQPIEMREITYQGRPRRQALIWSTANFLWGLKSDTEYVYTGAVFRIQAERRNGKVSVKGMDYDLVYNLGWNDAAGKKQLRLIPESDRELYKKDFPKQYEQMIREFEWAHKTLASPIKLEYSNGKKPAGD